MAVLLSIYYLYIIFVEKFPKFVEMARCARSIEKQLYEDDDYENRNLSALIYM